MIFPAGVFPDGVFPSGVFPGTLLESEAPTYPSVAISGGTSVFQQYVGTTKYYPFQILNSSNEVVESLISPVVYVKINNGVSTSASLDISDFDEIMCTFQLEVPDELNSEEMVNGDVVEIAVIDEGVGRGHLIVQFVGDSSAGGGGNLIVSEYTINPTLRTITPVGVTLQIEQIVKITMLNPRVVLYDCENPRDEFLGVMSISITDGVITYVFTGTVPENAKIRIEYNTTS